MDRRTRKTRQAIINAFMNLIMEKSFEQITISDIAACADVNRGTIYLHYVDKYDLLDQCVESFVTQLIESCRDNEASDTPSKDSMLLTFRYVEEHIHLYKALLLNKATSAFRDRLVGWIDDILDKQIDMTNMNKAMNKDVLIQFLSSAFIGTLEWWVINDMPYPATEMVEQVWLLIGGMQTVNLINNRP